MSPLGAERFRMNAFVRRFFFGSPLLIIRLFVHLLGRLTEYCVHQTL